MLASFGTDRELCADIIISCELKNHTTKSNKKSFVRRNEAMKIKEGRVAKTDKASWKT